MLHPGNNKGNPSDRANIEGGEAMPVKQQPYRINRVNLEHLHKEVEYIAENNIVESSDIE